MASLTGDSAYKVIEDGIKVDITTLIDNKRSRAALILIYSAMDTMAFLDMPANQTEVKSCDFVTWTNRYIRFVGKEQITGEEWYGARCGLLHTSRIVSRMSSKGNCRLIGYVDQASLPVTYRPSESTTLVMVSILALKQALFDGINRFLINVYSDKDKPAIVNPRIEEMVQFFPFEKNHV